MKETPPTKKWFKELRNILDTDPRNKKIAEKVMFVTRQSKNLLRALTSSKLKNETEVQRPIFEQGAGSRKCSRCHACEKVQNSKMFKSTNTKRKYPIRQKISCRSSYVIYLIFCRNCKGNYVGKTKREFRLRHSGHKQEITNRTGGLGQHFHQSNNRGCSYSHLEATLIEKVKQGDDVKLAERELYWQYQLRTFKENGGNAMNLKDDLN